MYLHWQPFSQYCRSLWRWRISELIQKMLDILGKMRLGHILHIPIERRTKTRAYNEGQQYRGQYEQQ